MQIEVEGPDGVIVEFPEGTDNATIERAMSQKFPKPRASAPAPAPSTPTANAPIVSEFTPFRLPTGQALTKQEDYDSLPDNIKQGLVTAATKDPHDWANTSFGEGWDRSLKKQGGWGLSENTRQWLGARQKDSIIPSFLSPIVDAPADIADLGFRGLQAAQAGAESGAELLDAASISTGVADALSWGGNKFLPGSGLMALAEAFPFGLEPGLAVPRLPNKLDADAPTNIPMTPEVEAQWVELMKTGTAKEMQDFMNGQGRTVDADWIAANEAYVANRDAGKPVGTDVVYSDAPKAPAGPPAPEDVAFREQFGTSATNTPVKPRDPVADAKAVEDARVEIAGYTEGWKNAPDFHVVNRLDELSEADRALMDPSAAAAVMPDGRVVFNRENIASPEHLKAAVFHEMLGHHGLTQRFGAVLDNTIEKIINSSPDFKARVDEWLDANPDTYADAPDRVIRAGDEVFAQMSEAGVIPLTVMNRIRNAIKEFLRAAGMKNVEYSQREIETILALAHDAVINGKPRDVAGNGFKLPARFMYVGDKAAKSKVDADGVLELNEDPHAERRVTAEKLFNEGADPEVIRQLTGWHVGPEGGWRREIDDSGATFRLNYFDFKRGDIPSMKLSEFIDHPELFDLYPNLKDIEIVGYKGPSNSLGWAEGNKIGINTASDADIMETLVHEIQHNIQETEGWLSGGNPASALKSMTNKQYAAFIDKKAERLEGSIDRHTERKELFEAALRYPRRRELHDARKQYIEGNDFKADAAAWREIEEDFRSFLEANTSPSKLRPDSRKAAVSDAISATLNRSLGGLIKSSEQAVNTYKDSLGHLTRDWQDRKKMLQRFGQNDEDLFKAYENMFGEIEARDTAARLNLDAENRAPVQPYSLERNLPTEEVIFAKGKGSSASIRETEPEPFSGMTQLPERRRAQEQAYGKEERRQRSEAARGVLSFQKSLVEQNRAEGRDALGVVPPAARFMREPYQKKSTSAESMRTVNDVDSLLGLLDSQNQAMRDDPMTMAELKRQADDLGLTPNKYARGKGIDDLPARIMAAHQVLTNSVDELATLGVKAETEGMTPTLHATIMEKLAVVQAVYGRFDNDAAAVGRALRTLKEVSESRKSAAAAARFMSEGGGAALAKDPIALQKFLGTLDAIRQTQGPEAAASAIHRAGKYKVEDYASSVVFNFMLSSPLTWAKNAVGAPINFGFDMISDGLGAIVGQASKLPGMSASADRVMGREMLARLHGAFAAFANWDTYTAIAAALKRGESTHAGLTGKTGTRGLPLSSNKNPLVKGAGLVIENPQRIMAAIDETWAGFFQMSNLYGEAARQAASEGLTGKAYTDRFRELAANPSEAILEKAHTTTNRQLFRDHDQMSRLARWITDAQTPRFEDETQIVMKKDVDGKLRPVSKTNVEKDSPIIRGTKFATRLALPFVPTIDSIARTVIRNTPVSALATALRSTGRERQAAMGRLVASSAVFGYFAMMAAEGNLTGVESPDRDEQATIGAARPPMSIKIGDEWVSYQGFDPIAAPMAMAATSVDRHNKGENTSEAMLGGITGLADALTKSTYMESAFQLVTMIQEATQSATDGKPLGPTLRNFFAGYGATLATPAGVRWANQKFNDPALRDTTADTTVTGRMAARAQAGWPGLSDELPQRHDVFGRPQQNLRQDRMVEKDPVVNEVVRLEELSDKLLIGPVGRDVKIGDGEGTVKLDAVQYQAYQKLAGEYLLSDLRDEMATEEWKTYSDEEKLEVIKEIRDIAREDARADLFAEVETAE